MKKKFLFLTLLLGIIGLTSCVGNDNPTESSSSTQEVSNTSSTSTGKPSSSTTSTHSSTLTGKPTSSTTSTPSSTSTGKPTSTPSSSATSTPSSTSTSTPSSTSTSTHNHDYSEEWSSDSTNHWHECSCGEKELQAAHTYGDFVVTKEATHTEDGSKKQTCSVCGYENVVVIPQLGHDLVHHDAKNPTCTEIGWNEYYTCSSCDYTTYQEIAALGHNYGNPVWTWDGYSSAKATFTCGNDSSHKEEVTATITSEVTTSAACETTGVRTYTATVIFGENTYTDTKTEEIPATGHSYGSLVWTWDGYSSAKATFTCENNTSHIEEVTATITSEVTTSSACEATGVRTYTATVTFGENTYTDTKTEEIAALGHSYGSPVWTWNEYSSAKATFTCGNDSSHTEEVTATITSEVTTSAACEATGVRTYTATVTFGGNTYTDTKTEEIPATGHNYGSPVWTWNEYSSAKVTFTCGNDSYHKEEVTATITSEVTTPATCEATGIKTYTATVTFGGNTYTDTKTEEIPAKGHTYGE